MIVYMNLLNVIKDNNPKGIGQYVLNLLGGMEKAGFLENVHLLLSPEGEEYLQGLFGACERTVFPYPALMKWMPFKKYFFQILYHDFFALPRFMRKQKNGLLFHPYNAMTIWVSAKQKTVVVVHDLFYKNHPNAFAKFRRCLLDVFYSNFLWKADRVIVPSQFVKEDILKHFPFMKDKAVRVIHNPVEILEAKLSPPEDSPYILSVNSLSPHKNITTLIRAFARIEERIPHRLVLTGYRDPRGESSIETTIRESGIKKIEFTGYISNEKRNALFAHADLFVSPSLHEGFGMTPVEAALLGAPVLTTRMTSLPEATQERVSYYDPPTDENALAKKMLDMLDHPPTEHERMSIKGQFRKAYEASSVAQKYIGVFREIC